VAASQSARLFTTSSNNLNPQPMQVAPPPDQIDPLDLNPNTALAQWAEERLLAAGTPPIGSRRRRAALRTSADIPFEQLPYQCFQEARKILAADREQKLEAISAELTKIKWLEGLGEGEFKGGEKMREIKLASMRRYVERLKILADINDPLVKRRFEDGMGTLPPSLPTSSTTKSAQRGNRKVLMNVKQAT
jgi:large subunit ribosomal protein L35